MVKRGWRSAPIQTTHLNEPCHSAPLAEPLKSLALFWVGVSPAGSYILAVHCSGYLENLVHAGWDWVGVLGFCVGWRRENGTGALFWPVASRLEPQTCWRPFLYGSLSQADDDSPASCILDPSAHRFGHHVSLATCFPPARHNSRIRDALTSHSRT